MSRAPTLDPAKLNDEQRRVYDEITARLRTGAASRGPFAVLLNAPKVAHGAITTYGAFRDGKIDKRLFELMILVVARHMSAQFEWFAHAPRAVEAGIAQATVDAIKAHRTPDLAREDERMVYDVVTEICTTRSLSQPNYDRALAILGLEQLAELIAGTGFYVMIATVLNAFDVLPPDGQRVLPP
jgi:4-carboxymuconolactone decarboxylase